MTDYPGGVTATQHMLNADGMCITGHAVCLVRYGWAVVEFCRRCAWSQVRYA